MCTQTITIDTQCRCTANHLSYCQGVLKNIRQNSLEIDEAMPQYKNGLNLKRVRETLECVCDGRTCPKAWATQTWISLCLNRQCYDLYAEGG